MRQGDGRGPAPAGGMPRMDRNEDALRRMMYGMPHGEDRNADQANPANFTDPQQMITPA